MYISATSIRRHWVPWAGGLAVLAVGLLVWTFQRDGIREFMEKRRMQSSMSTPFPPMEARPELPARGGRTTEQVLETLGPVLEPGWARIFQERGLEYPPSELALVALKDKWVLQVYARAPKDPATRPDKSPPLWVYLRSYPVLAGSGVRGPKLREGDRQVPEGIYGIEYLNPNSAYHLSFKLNYPNPVDLERAQAEGRDQPGSDIMVHGRAISAGCLAMGDPAVEELFTLVARTGAQNVTTYLAPRDFRLKPPRPSDLEPPAGRELLPSWTADLYAELHQALAQFPVE